MKKLFLSILLIVICAAFAIAQRPTETTKKAAEFLNRGDFQGAIKILDEAISHNKDLPEAYRMRSFVKSLQGDLPGSISDLDEAIKINSSDAELYAQRANFKVFLRDESAFADFNSAIANGYKNYKVYLGRALFQRNKGNLEAAETDYRTAYGLNPEAPRAVIGYASILEQIGKTDQATAILQEYISTYEQKNDGKLPVAKVEETIRGKEIIGEKTETGNSRTIMVGKSVQVNNVKGLSGEDVENIGNTAAAYSHIARMQIRSNQIDAAFTNIQKSIKLNGSEAYSIGLRGQIYLQKGEFQNALEDFDKSIKLMPQMPNYYIDRGITHLALGNKAKAQADFDKFLEINPRGKKYMDKRIEEAKVKFNINQ